MFPIFYDGPEKAGDGRRDLRKGEVAAALGLRDDRVRKLMGSGLLPHGGNARLFDGDVVHQLSLMPWLRVKEGELTVLRTDSRTPNGYPGDPRKFEGFHVDMDDRAVADACLRWWRSDPARVQANQLFSVTIATFPTAVFSVSRADERDGLPASIRVAHENFARHRYNGTLLARIRRDRSLWIADGLPEDVEAPVRQIMRSRVYTKSGGPIAYLEPHNGGGKE
jgi:hypothetical protein